MSERKRKLNLGYRLSVMGDLKDLVEGWVREYITSGFGSSAEIGNGMGVVDF